MEGGREIDGEMEMRAMEDAEIGEDLTPPLFPLSFSLHPSFLLSHCSFCFSPLPLPPTLPSHLHYCSSPCSDSDSDSPFSSASSHVSVHSLSSDLLASLRLLFLLLRSYSSTSLPPPPSRIFGLLTNRDKLMSLSRNDDDDEISMRIRDGAKVLASFRRRDSLDIQNDTAFEEAVLCLVMTNAVEVLDSEGRALGIAVYNAGFSWINHSCSPNASYRFLLSPLTDMAVFSTRMRPRIFPSFFSSNAGVQSSQIESDMYCDFQDLMTPESKNCGPRIVVRSIKRIKRGEQITVAYTDLLRPKVWPKVRKPYVSSILSHKIMVERHCDCMLEGLKIAKRRSELWSKYHFLCSCQRCCATPMSYVDYALQEFSSPYLELSSSSPNSAVYSMKIERLTDYVDDVITEYLSVGDPAMCCHNLEKVLTLGFCDEDLQQKQSRQLPPLKLHPHHNLSLDIYTSLSSAYQVYSTSLMASSSKGGGHLFEAFEMRRISTAYSLLLASATHHLFQSEASLIASAANFWTSSGESSLNLSRSSQWVKFLGRNYPLPDLSLMVKNLCSGCTWVDKLSSCNFCCRALYAEFQDVSNEFLNCVTNLSKNVWGFLSRGHRYLTIIKSPFDLGCHEKISRSAPMDLEAHSTDYLESYWGTKNDSCVSEYKRCLEQVRISIFWIGVHCLLYGSYLTSVCYGEQSQFACRMKDILNMKIPE